jgi:hypothetical protein
MRKVQGAGPSDLIDVENRARPYIVADNRTMGIIGDGLEILKLVNIGANAELYGKLAKFVEETQELKAKVEALEETNRDLIEQLRFKGNIVRVQGNVYVDGDDERIAHVAQMLTTGQSTFRIIEI